MVHMLRLLASAEVCFFLLTNWSIHGGPTNLHISLKRLTRLKTQSKKNVVGCFNSGLLA